MGGGSSQHRAPVLAGTYLAEQMSPATFTLVSATAPKGGEKKLNDKQKKQKFKEQVDGVGCTVLPALASIDPLLSKDPNAKSTSAASQKQVASNKKQREETQKRIYTQKKQNDGALFEDFADKTNEDLITFLSRPKDGVDGQAGTESRSNFSSTSRLAQSMSSQSVAQSSASSLRSPRIKRSHENHYDLFQTALRGVGGPSEGTKRGLKLYSPGSTRQRKQPPLAEQIKPIKIAPECSVDALKAAEKQQAAERQAEEWAKAAGGGSSKATLFKTKMQKVMHNMIDTEERKMNVSNKMITAMKPDNGENQEDGGEKVLECVLPSHKIPQARKEACDALRFFIFGVSDAEKAEKEREMEKQAKVEKPEVKDDKGKKDQKEEKGKKAQTEKAETTMLPERIFYQPRGSREDAIKVLKTWYKLDDDQSGRVDIAEFRQFTSSIGNDKLADKVCAALLGKKSSFTIEDMMRIIWPCATGKDVKIMKMWMDEYKDSIKVVKTPPLLPQEELEALQENFKFFDQDNDGNVSFTELVESGLLDREAADRYLADYDKDGSGELDKDEFCEVFCLNGYRAFEGTKQATDSEGNHIVYDDFVGWHLKIDPKKAPDLPHLRNPPSEESRILDFFSSAY